MFLSKSGFRGGGICPLPLNSSLIILPNGLVLIAWIFLFLRCMHLSEIIDANFIQLLKLSLLVHYTDRIQPFLHDPDPSHSLNGLYTNFSELQSTFGWVTRHLICRSHVKWHSMLDWLPKLVCFGRLLEWASLTLPKTTETHSLEKCMLHRAPLFTIPIY